MLAVSFVSPLLLLPLLPMLPLLVLLSELLSVVTMERAKTAFDFWCSDAGGLPRRLDRLALS